jgi:hypothetical protein
MEAIKVKAIWHNCNMCKIHYMSEYPHLRAYLCDECWNSIPHMKVINQPKVMKGPTYNLRDFSVGEILLYTVGNIICVMVIGYYLWFK